MTLSFAETKVSNVSLTLASYDEINASSGRLSELTTSPPSFYNPESANALNNLNIIKKGSPFSITERRVPELIPVFGSQPAGDVSHKPGDMLPLLSTRPAVTLATLKRAAANLAAW